MLTEMKRRIIATFWKMWLNLWSKTLSSLISKIHSTARFIISPGARSTPVPAVPVICHFVNKNHYSSPVERSMPIVSRWVSTEVARI
jgi:hypothetical protein